MNNEPRQSAKIRFKCTPCVFIYLTRESKNGKEILLQLRENTGYMDGKYHFGAAGHVEAGETFAQAAIREAAEEIGVEILPEDLILKYISYSLDEAYLRCVFGAKTYTGTPHVCEPNKCAGLLWAKIDDLPENIAPYIPDIIHDIEHGGKFDRGIM